MEKLTAATPAVTKASKISSVAYAVDDMASEEKTGRAYFLGRRSCISSAVAIGLPTRPRLIIEPAPKLSHSSKSM